MRLILEVLRYLRLLLRFLVCIHLLLKLLCWAVCCARGWIPNMSDNLDALRTSAMECSLRQFDTCSHLRVNFDTHGMCESCMARAGRKVCTREDNCIAWDDITWDMDEAILAKKEKLRQRKREKVVAAARSCSMSSKDSVSMFPDSTAQESLDFRECESSSSTHKSIVKVVRSSPTPWDTDVDWPRRKRSRRTPHWGNEGEARRRRDEDVTSGTNWGQRDELCHDQEDDESSWNRTSSSEGRLCDQRHGSSRSSSAGAGSHRKQSTTSSGHAGAGSSGNRSAANMGNAGAGSWGNRSTADQSGHAGAGSSGNRSTANMGNAGASSWGNRSTADQSGHAGAGSSGNWSTAGHHTGAVSSGNRSTAGHSCLAGTGSSWNQSIMDKAHAGSRPPSRSRATTEQKHSAGAIGAMRTGIPQMLVQLRPVPQRAGLPQTRLTVLMELPSHRRKLPGVWCPVLLGLFLVGFRLPWDNLSSARSSEKSKMVRFSAQLEPLPFGRGLPWATSPVLLGCLLQESWLPRTNCGVPGPPRTGL